MINQMRVEQQEMLQKLQDSEDRSARNLAAVEAKLQAMIEFNRVNAFEFGLVSRFVTRRCAGFFILFCRTKRQSRGSTTESSRLIHSLSSTTNLESLSKEKNFQTGLGELESQMPRLSSQQLQLRNRSAETLPTRSHRTMPTFSNGSGRSPRRNSISLTPSSKLPTANPSIQRQDCRVVSCCSPFSIDAAQLG